MTGYIRNAVTETSLPIGKFNQGCITDCENYKLEVRMPLSENIESFTPGMHISLIGEIKYFRIIPYFWITKKEDVKLASNEVKSRSEYMKGNKMPKRVKDESDKNLKVKITFFKLTYVI